MFRVNYLPPEQMPSHQRDFPRHEKLPSLRSGDGSSELLMLVVLYLLAMLGGIVLLGQLTPVKSPSMHVSASRAV
jgi:hypothetical protein